MRLIAPPGSTTLLIVAAMPCIVAEAQGWPDAREAVRTLAASGYGEAAENIRAAIPLIATAESGETDQLIDAWTAIGQAYVANDLHALAVDAYENAIGVSRRDLGLLNERQVDVRWLQSQAALAGGDVEAADRYRDESRSIAYRSRRAAVEEIGTRHGIDSREYVDAMLAHARWLVSERDWIEARASYSGALDALARLPVEDPELMVRTLQEVASTIGFRPPFHVSTPDIWGAAFKIGPPLVSIRPTELDQARRTLNRMESPEPVLRALVLRDWADWELNLDRISEARRTYREALELLEQVEGGEELAREWFDGPVLLQQPPFLPCLLALFPVAPSAPRGQVELTVSVTRTGWADEVRVMRADPEWMAVAAVSLVSGSRFRPLIVDGEPVSAKVHVTWAFRYDPMIRDDPLIAEYLGLTGSDATGIDEPGIPVRCR